MQRRDTDFHRLHSSSPSAPLRSSTPLHDEGNEFSANSSSDQESCVADDTAVSLDSCSLPTLDVSLISCEEESISEITISREISPHLQTSTSPVSAEHWQQPKSINAGYKLVFDNIDKNVKPRYMRSDSQTLSLHYVQVYGVKDRIDYSSLSGEKPTQVNLYSVLPDTTDYDLLRKDFTILVSRIIVKYLPFFNTHFKKSVVQHIPHKYSTEMCKKSEVVS